MNRKLQSLYGLKWNPFGPDVPTEAAARPLHRLGCVAMLLAALQGGLLWLGAGRRGAARRWLCCRAIRLRRAEWRCTLPVSSLRDPFAVAGVAVALFEPHGRAAGT